MTITIPLAQAPVILALTGANGRVFIPGGPLEPVALAAAFADQPHHAAGLTFCGMMIPDINTTDWAALHNEAQAEVFLPSRDLAKTIAQGRTKVLPLHYSAAYEYLCATPFHAAVFHVCPPDENGQCNMSLSADSSAAFFDRPASQSVFKLGIINSGLPRIAGAPSVPVTMFDATTEINQAPIQIDTPRPRKETSPAIAQIAAHIATLVEDGATLQTGIGKLPSAVMAALTNHRDLKLHSGLIGEWALDLMASGSLSVADKAITVGVILGSPALHDALHDDVRVALVPINETHNASKLATIERFTSLNAALEIDLFGQINCEYAGDKTVAGIGGALDFLRGARASKGGKPIIMIASEGAGGDSRIVPRLATPTISITRSDAPILVTEHGYADLALLDIQARALAITALAAPQHRGALALAWKDLAG